MSVSDVFMAPVDGSNPSGIELRNDMRFHALERLIAPANKAARDPSDGPQTPVDWDEVLTEAEALAAEGRDLRLLVIVARALANRDGFAGLGAGLDMLARTVAEYWDSLHPELRDRPEPRDAAVRRINALRQLENGEDGLLGDLEIGQVFTVRGLGPVSGGDLAAACLSDSAFRSGLASGLGEAEIATQLAAHQSRLQRVTTAARAFATEQPEEHATLGSGVASADTALTALETALTEKLGGDGIAVTFGDLRGFLDRVSRSLAAEPAEEQLATPAGKPVDTGGEAMQSSAPLNGAAPPAAVAGQINSRREVERYLDLIIDFYDRTEPASPIPHLARRMRKMVPMNFLQLMEEVAPSGIKEFRNIAGVPDDKK